MRRSLCDRFIDLPYVKARGVGHPLQRLADTRSATVVPVALVGRGVVNRAESLRFLR